MDELQGLCARLLGDSELAATAAAEASQAEGRVRALRQALAICRSRRGSGRSHAPSGGGLAETVATELAAAAGRLPQRQQEALALRDLVGLPHVLLAEVLEIESAAAVALLARSRIRLRAELRAAPTPAETCPERERTRRTVTLRLDAEAVAAADEDWLMEHLGHCGGCRRVHATMLEAAAAYRSWPVTRSGPAPSAEGPIRRPAGTPA